MDEVPKVLIFPPFLFSASFAAAWALDRWLMPWPWLHGGGLRHGVAWPLIALGLGLAVWAELALKAKGVDPRFKPVPGVAVSGPYRYTRNPMYIGVVLVMGGMAALLDNLWIIAVLAICLPVLHFGVVLREEAYLSARLGEEYRQLFERSRRWL